MNQELHIVVMPDGSLHPEWVIAEEPVSESARRLQEEIFKRRQADENEWLLYIGFCDKTIAVSPSLNFWRNFAGAFVKKLSRTPDLEIFRHSVDISIAPDELRSFLDNAPLMTGSEYVTPELLASVWERIQRAFSEAVKSFKGTVAEFIRTYQPDVHLAGRVYFHLVENKDSEFPFAFLATYSTRLNREGKSKHLPLKYALQEYGKDSRKLLELLTTVHTAAKQSQLVADLLETGELFHPLAWTPKEAFNFLKETPLYENSGILCRIPNWWKGGSPAVKLNVSIGDSQPAYVGMNAILQFNVRMFLEDEEISEKEIRLLLQQTEGLAFIKNKWVAVDPEKIKSILQAYEQSKELIRDGLSFREALRLQLNPEKLISADAGDDFMSISHGEWLESVIMKLRRPEMISDVHPGDDFRADLRPYQKKGINWLHYLHSLQFGACLADDMGLGKTVQMLGFLNAIKSKNGKKAANGKKANLLIIPASLIANWISEIRRFSPNLTCYAAHPEMQTSKITGPPENLDAIDIVITTYSLVQKYQWLQSYPWNYVILDEAQAIKNTGTKQTRAVKKLSAYNRIAMTGTPIENRLSDLWSLFDFLNPGLLGTAKEFSRFSKQIKENASGYSRLRKLISPYILRRLKTDKTVISDLPDKVEMKTYAPLSKKQVVLYHELIESVKQTIMETEGIQRKGLILASLMKFKQICNHPDQYLGTGTFEEEDSGKFGRLKEICEIIFEKREKALVFTQFKEMTEPLHDCLKKVFGKSGLILHGSTPVKKRKEMIDQFQHQGYIPFMVLSLKAGGVGLNLTEASHVIHFDRWWNPAVENQATDRAFRIGQKKNVMVHKFLTKGTVEERIDLMLEEKSAMSKEIISGLGENWITEMNNEEILNLFKLTL